MANQFVIYPNPTNSICVLNIPVDITEPVNIKIFKANGEEIVTVANIKDKQYELDVSGFSIGLYYISIISDKEFLTKKLVISE